MIVLGVILVPLDTLPVPSTPRHYRMDSPDRRVVLFVIGQTGFHASADAGIGIDVGLGRPALRSGGITTPAFHR